MESNASEKIAYTLEQVSDMLSIGKTKIYAEIKAGRLKVRKWGSRNLVFREDLDAFLATLPVVTPTPVPNYTNN